MSSYDSIRLSYFLFELQIPNVVWCTNDLGLDVPTEALLTCTQNPKLDKILHQIESCGTYIEHYI